MGVMLDNDRGNGEWWMMVDNGNEGDVGDDNGGDNNIDDDGDGSVAVFVTKVCFSV